MQEAYSTTPIYDQDFTLILKDSASLSSIVCNQWMTKRDISARMNAEAFGYYPRGPAPAGAGNIR
jgi:hypothetical protein